MLGVLCAFVAGAGAYQAPVTPQGQSTSPQTPQQTQSPPQTPEEIKAAQAEKQHQADIQLDIDKGKNYAAQVEKSEKLSTNKEMIERVQRIGAEIAAIANSGPVKALWGDKRFNKFNYTYKVLRGDDVNAFSLPGGHIYVFEGLMRDIQSDDELAGVLGHETAHAAFRHVSILEHNEDKLQMASLPLILASLILGRGSAAPAAIEGSQLIAQAKGSGWSVQAEEAADYGGFQYLEKSRYDPTGMLTFMERMGIREKLLDTIDWGIYATHPPSPARALALTKEMQDAGIQAHRSRVSTTFRVTAKPLDNGLIELDFGKRPLVALAGPDAPLRASKDVITLNNFFDSTPELYEMQAGAGGNILGRSRPLLTLTKDDANASGMNLDDLCNKTFENMRIALFSIGYRVWAGRT